MLLLIVITCPYGLLVSSHVITCPYMTLIRVRGKKLELVFAAIKRGWQRRHRQTQVGQWTMGIPCKMHNLPRLMGRPRKGQRVDGFGKKCGRISKQIFVPFEEAKRRPRECLGWPVAGDRSQQEGGDSSTVVTVTVHTFLHLTLCGTLSSPLRCATVLLHCVTLWPPPWPSIQQHSVSGNGSDL